MDVQRPTSALKSFAVAAALCLALVALFWPVFFQGKVLVPGDLASTNPFLYTDSTRLSPPRNTLLSDQIEQFYVWQRFAGDTIRSSGQIPLWNPYILTGQPLVADSQSSLFWPPNLLLRFFSPGVVATIRVFFNLIFGAVFTCLFARQAGISRSGAILSATAFGFSGPVLVWIGFPLCNVLVCLPFLMWAGEKLLAGPTLLRTALLGTGMGLSLLGGHPETTFQVLAVFSLYLLGRTVTAAGDGRRKGKLALAFCAAVAIGAVISAIQLLPFLDFMRDSATFSRGGRGGHGGGAFFYSEEWLPHLATAVTLLCPNFFGNPLDHSYLWPFTTFQNYNEQAVYFGLVPLALAAAALAAPKNRQLLLVSILAVFSLAVAWRLPLFETVNHLPIFSMAPNKRLRLTFVFFAAVLAGHGFDTVCPAVRVGWKRQGSLRAAAAVLLAAIVLFGVVLTLKLVGAEALHPFFPRLLGAVFAFDQWRSYLPLVIAVGALGAALSSLRSPRIAPLLPAALAVLSLGELLAFGWGYNPAVREETIFPAAPAVADLKRRTQEPFRILTTDGYFYPNYGTVYGIADVAGYDAPIYQSCSDIYLAQGGKSVGGQIDSRQHWEPEWPLVDFLNVRYVISPRDLPPDKFRMLYENRYFAVYENPMALPRAFLVYQVETVANRKEMLDRMISRPADLRTRVLLDEPLPVSLGGAGGDSSDSVRFLKFGADEVVMAVTTARPGMLVMSDIYTPDWLGMVDGAAAKVYRADYAYRAMAVPAGSHTVTFRYAPLSYRLGRWLTGAGLLLVLLLAATGLRSGRSTGSGPAGDTDGKEEPFHGLF